MKPVKLGGHFPGWTGLDTGADVGSTGAGVTGIGATVGDTGGNVGVTGAEVGGVIGALVGGVTGALVGGVVTGASVGLDSQVTNCSKLHALILTSNSFPSPQSCSLVKDPF